MAALYLPIKLLSALYMHILASWGVGVGAQGRPRSYEVDLGTSAMKILKFTHDVTLTSLGSHSIAKRPLRGV